MSERIYPKAFDGVAQPEYGLNANVIKSKTFDLAVARNMHAVEIGGNLLWTMEATSRTAYIDVRFNDQLRDPVRYRLGLFIRGMPFSRIYVTNAAQAGESLTLFYAVEERGKIEIENPSLQFTEVDITKSTVLQSATDVTLGAAATTAILAADPARRAVIIGNLSTNAEVLRIGPVVAGAARGQELLPGESITLETTAAIYGYNPGAAGQDVSVIWTAD